MDKNAKKKKKKSKSGDVKSYFKESVLVSKRNFHKLLSFSSSVPPGSHKTVIRSKMGQKMFDFNREDDKKENISLFISSSSSAIKKQGIDSVIQILPMDPTQSLY